ncbi:hypothetical protein JG687_00016680 [Phytophthora cactorum]|uniref:MULE transposase domain-containing protein n=1 Tax=Phytophthora cactorum TaxID=29920 RepID=A0A8T1TVB4_9STRA|nr:hypothetical protein JG687_00016680 [Phytophthora cactorum]
MVEVTHITNDARFKLFSCMIHDDVGHVPVQVFIADEDCDEIALLREKIPGATILLCVFHVVKYLRREMAKSDFGVFDREKWRMLFK